MKRTSLAALIGLSLTSTYATAATLTSGHVDAIGIGYDGTNLEPHIHADEATIDGVPDVSGEFEPGDLVIGVPGSTFTYTTGIGGRAAGSAWDPIGVAAGESYWFLPQGGALSDSLGAPFAGIAAEELDPLDWTGNITVTLTAASMPVGGHFSLNRVVSGVPTFFMATLGGIDSSDSVAITPGGHVHYNWYFTEEGNYDLTFEITGTHVADGFKSATATYSFSVIPEPSSAVLGAIGALALLRRRR